MEWNLLFVKLKMITVVKSYELKDEDLKQIVVTICDNIRDGSFDAKGEVDLSEYL